MIIGKKQLLRCGRSMWFSRARSDSVHKTPARNTRLERLLLVGGTQYISGVRKGHGLDFFNFSIFIYNLFTQDDAISRRYYNEVLVVSILMYRLLRFIDDKPISVVHTEPFHLISLIEHSRNSPHIVGSTPYHVNMSLRVRDGKPNRGAQK